MSQKLSRSPATENLAETYFSLGLAVAGAKRHEEIGFSCCLGSLPHPICNFALNLNLDPWSVQRLREIASSSRDFQVYHAPGDTPEEPDSLMRRAGFMPSYRLVQMVAEPAQSSSVHVLEAETEDDRTELARFMIDQFFAHQHSSFRRIVTQATADSGLDIRAIKDGNEITAAMMLCQTDASIGVYNLGVRSAKRNRGIGSHMV
ncbi:MAG: hypothetical protein ACAH95_16785, partial [Fimbriimonas sp.]